LDVIRVVQWTQAVVTPSLVATLDQLVYVIQSSCKQAATACV
jgi:hypothetical protein